MAKDVYEKKESEALEEPKIEIKEEVSEKVEVSAVKKEIKKAKRVQISGIRYRGGVKMALFRTENGAEELPID